MKKHVVGLVAVLAFVSFVSAQDKLLNLDEIFSPDSKVRVRFGGTPVSVQWAPDGRTFKQSINGRLMRVDAMTGQAVPYYDAGSLANALMRTGVKFEDATVTANSPALQFNRDGSAIVLNRDNDLWLYDVNTRSLKRLTNSRDEEKEEAFSPDGRYVSFVRGNNLFVVDTAKANEKQLTRDGREGDKAIYNGYLDWVYEEELYGRGQKRGYWWSPDSKYVAFLRLDETPVPKFIIPNDIPQDQDVETTFYPQAGDPNPVVRLGIADVGKTTLLPNAGRIPKIGERLPPSLVRVGDAVTFADLDQYKADDLLIGRVAWTPDSRSVVFQAQNREQTFLDLNAAALSGKVAKLFTENSPAWVGINDNPFYLSDGTFIWESERDGWNHLYLYGRDGRMIRRLTSGKWEVRTVYGIDDANQWVYFSATKDSPVAENVYRMRIADGTVERLTQGSGWHAPAFNAKFTHFVDMWSDARTPVQTRLFRSDGSLERVINENRAETLAQYRLGPVEFMQVPTRDGFQMEAMMIKPPDFDPTRRYPVLSYTYSGPHAQSVVDRWGGNRYLWHQMMAQKGYIIWICDNRTASGKGLESTWAVYKRFGELELRDLEDGVAYLKTLPYVDGSRIGMWGWSFGGFMTSYALTHSDVFRMGIAGGTVSDWRNYDSIYTERYMLTPKNNPEGYDRSSVLKAAGNLNGKLLLIHGGNDDNVHVQNTTQLAYELQKADKQFDLMLYPTARHGLTNAAQIKHWYTMMTEFVMKNL